MKRFILSLAFGALASAATVQSLQRTVTPAAEEMQSAQDELRCLARNIYFEGRNQNDRAMAAIGQVTINRQLSPNFPDTICGVVRQGPLDGSKISKHRCQFSWYCDGKEDIAPVNQDYAEIEAWDRAQGIAYYVYYIADHDITAGSTYYHANYVDPYWNASMELVAEVGSHLFYVD